MCCALKRGGGKKLRQTARCAYCQGLENTGKKNKRERYEKKKEENTQKKKKGKE